MSGSAGGMRKGARGGKYMKRRSVSFEDDLPGGGSGGGGREVPGNVDKDVEERRRERRRSEAKAAIEVGFTWVCLPVMGDYLMV